VVSLPEVGRELVVRRLFGIVEMSSDLLEHDIALEIQVVGVECGMEHEIGKDVECGREPNGRHVGVVEGGFLSCCGVQVAADVVDLPRDLDGGAVLGAYHKVKPTVDELKDGVSPGSEARVWETPVGRLGGIICFDLNFDDLRRQYAALRPEMLLFPSMFHGGALIEGWAVDCRCHIVAATQLEGSGIVDPLGRTVAATNCYCCVARATINLDYEIVHLDFNREQLDALARERRGDVTVEIPPHIGRVIIENRTDRYDLAELIEEFEIETLDHYFERAGAEIERHR